MVTIIKAHERKSEKGTFISLELQGDVEMVQSQATGRFYATAKRAFVSSTFELSAAKGLVGTTMKGSIERAECDPYEYTVPDTGEVVLLAHTYSYVPEEKGGRPPVSQLVPMG